MTSKKPRPLRMKHVTAENERVVVRMTGTLDREFELSLSSADVTTLIAMLKASHDDVFSKTDSVIPTQPLRIHHIEAGHFDLTGVGKREGLQIFITDTIHHDYFFDEAGMLKSVGIALVEANDRPDSENLH